MRSRATQKITRPNLSIRQVAPHFPQAVAETATVRHAERPAKFELLDIATDQFSVLHGKPSYPFPHRLVAHSSFVEERRELLGTIYQ